jgi:cytochrome o ubiquinol oxidase subunit 1
MKEEGRMGRVVAASFADLHLPRNSPVGFFLAFFAVILGFALIWRIYWLAGLGLLGAVAVALIEFWKTDLEVRVPAQEVAAFEHAHVTPDLRAPSGDFETVHESSGDRDRLKAASGGRS